MMFNMKRLLLILFLVFMALFTFACNKDKDNNDNNGNQVNVTEFLTILESNGYDMETFDQESRDFFSNLQKTNHDIDVTCVGYHSGYITVPETGRYVRLLAFATEAQAVAYVNALSADDDDVLLYREGVIVVETYSQETFDLFNE